MLGGSRDVRDRQREVEPDVAVHVREPAGLANERVAVQQHERRLAEALDQRLEVGRVGAPEVQVGVAEAAVHLHGQRIAASPRSPPAPRRRAPTRDRGRRGTPRSSSARRSPRSRAPRDVARRSCVSMRSTGRARQPASSPSCSHSMPVPGGGKPSSTSSHSVPVARRSDAAYSSDSRLSRCSYTASSVGFDAEVSRERRASRAGT